MKEPQASTEFPGEANPPARERFYAERRRIYTGLLLFVALAGVPVVSVPYLRNRLSARVAVLRAALAGNIKPAIAQVGANQESLPAEYARPEPPVPQPPQLPPVERIFTMTPTGRVAPHRERRRAPPLEAIKAEPHLSKRSQESAEQPASAAPAASADSELKYQKGKIEQDAYELLLKSNATVAGMVRGSNPSLHFKSWDAADRGDNTYWVRLKFQSEGNPADVEYIWQVKLQTNQVTPLSYNARTIS